MLDLHLPGLFLMRQKAQSLRQNVLVLTLNHVAATIDKLTYGTSNCNHL
jgi:hypothetical protein